MQAYGKKCLQLFHRFLHQLTFPAVLVPDCGNRPSPSHTSMELPVHSPSLQPTLSKFWNQRLRQNPEMCGMHKRSSLCPHIELCRMVLHQQKVPSKSPIKYCSCAQFAIRPSPTFSCQNPRQPATGINPGTPKTFTVTGRGEITGQVQLFKIRRGY